MARKRLATIGAGLFLVVALAVLGSLPSWWRAPPAIAAIGGPFTLVDQTGKTVTDADYRGKIKLVYFGYTYCPDLCPTTLATLAQALDRLTPPERDKIVPLFITVDPERDTPARMADYVAAFSPLLVGLTGSPEQIAAVEKGYRIYAKRSDLGGGNYGVDHSSLIYVMAADGHYLDHLDPNATADDIVAGLRKIL